MPSPILPSEFESLVSTSGTPACTSFKNFNTFISRFSEWYSWAFSSDGTISPEYAAELNSSLDTVKPGSLIYYSGRVDEIPDGYVVANGAAYDGNVSAYADLYSKIGTIHGGDTISNFKVPNLLERYIEGTYTAAQIGKVNSRLIIGTTEGDFEGTVDDIREDYVGFFDNQYLNYKTGVAKNMTVIRGFPNESERNKISINHNWGITETKIRLGIKIKTPDSEGVYELNEEVFFDQGFIWYQLEIATKLPTTPFWTYEYINSVSVIAENGFTFEGVIPVQVFNKIDRENYTDIFLPSEIPDPAPEHPNDGGFIPDPIELEEKGNWFSLPKSDGTMARRGEDNITVTGDLIVILKKVAKFNNDYSFLNSLKAIPLIKL
jgi:hypothetical protein